MAALVAAAALSLLVCALHGVEASTMNLRARQARFTVADKVYIDGSLFAEGSALEGQLYCQPHKGTSTFKVCGCGVKVEAHVLTECQTYKQYDAVIGKCDCGASECDELTLMSGYTKKFEFNATSFKISACG